MYIITQAVGEAERGKTYKLTHVAPKMELSVRQQAIDDIGDTEHARFGKAAAAKMAPTKVTSKKEPSTAAAPKPSSAASSAPSAASSAQPTPKSKPEAKVMPKGQSREGPPRKEDSTPSKCKKSG